MGKEVQYSGSVLNEDVGDVVGVVLADGSEHGDALEGVGPVAFDVGVEDGEEGFV